MPTPILATKLYIPPPRPKAVPRPRLIARLNEGLERKLTLISAPAGFGKTTLVSEWMQSARQGDKETGRAEDAIAAPFAIAWLSLDEGDNDPFRFLTYLIAALQTFAPQIGAGVLALLQSPQPPPSEALLTALLNELTSIPETFVLVLDDYHVVDAKTIDDVVIFLLEHMPPQMHLAITTREDPPLPLPRYRVRGQLTEVRAADLRFTPDEAAQFLNQMMDLDLSASEIAELESRTEGWVAGLQMAALSIQGRADSASFIHAFTGSHRFVLDYLAEEVLQRQPEQVRNFLLQTAILERLCAPLCAAVTDQRDGKGTLEALERGNLFVIPLDDQRHWYRYHHLFADVLQARLKEEQPAPIPTLHLRASRWYEANGLRADAIRHAFAAEDLERAANLVERTWLAMHQNNFRSPKLLGWLEALPDELIRVRPWLSVGYAWELLNNGEFEAADSWMREAEQWLKRDIDTHTDTGIEADTSADNHADIRATVNERPQSMPGGNRAEQSHRMVVADEAVLRNLPAELASARAYYAQALGDVSGTVRYARQALDLIPKTDYIRRGPAASLLGLAYWSIGDLEEAYHALAEGMASFEQAGNIPFAISGTFGLADIRIAQGRLRGAIATYERALQLAMQEGGRALEGTADLHLGLSELHRARGNYAAAQEQMAQSQAVDEQTEQHVYPYHLCLVQARTKQEQGDIDGALRLLDEAAELFAQIHIPDFRPVAVLKVRVWLAHGQLTEAQRWVSERGLTIDDDLSFLREFEHITLVRVLIAQSRNEQSDNAHHQVIDFLERLLHAAEVGERMGSLIEILILQALTHASQGDIPAALVPLERALTLAEPEGYVRIFVDEGPPMARLLRQLLTQFSGQNSSEAVVHGTIPDYVNVLLAAFEFEELENKEQENSANSTLPQVSPGSASPAHPLIEPLSQREIEVLHLIAQGLSNREIGERLFLSVNTVKGHNRIIFGKLQVQRRTEAVARAREMGLI